ncbi:type I-F CRISPR-associated endoribonuclease Cas6/Csy4 [Photobacterium sp. GB-27]|uniref:type I-F CRISPR-associated endoribonuclease Cas6/Csy4 n=1 Tax=Photobacterium sp. GB-27 TaxID=2022109 RepID=UPI000D17B191|nr:type I-F CRISPR-associated endoribonuclease Cas6/Csy4 [Photobacterium sp. GB-27]PSV30343.1 type I-F CRISPR-associated endoribonuclease Cas6/Csy4 [Photobacterium sp. GB-27]
MKALHSIFATSIKNTGTNPYGIAFPAIQSDSVGQFINVYCPEEVDAILTNQRILSLLAGKKLSCAGIKSLAEIKPTYYRAFIRDRKRERGAPVQAMKRMMSSNKENKEQLAKTLIGRYFQSTLPQINLSSQSSQRAFTLNIAVQDNDVQPEQQKLSFNAYGLSSYKNPMYLPVESIE